MPDYGSINAENRHTECDKIIIKYNVRNKSRRRNRTSASRPKSAVDAIKELYTWENIFENRRGRRRET